MLDQAAEEGARGQFARDELSNVPALTTYEAILWDAFTTLSTERQLTGMGGVGPIPWRATIAYANHHKFNLIETNDLVKAVAALDPVYIRDAANRANKAAKGRSST